MKPRERRDGGQQDFFRARLEAVINMAHVLVRLARLIDWVFLEKVCGEAYKAGPGNPPLPTRLMVGLEVLKYSYNVSDERLCEAWLENPYFQYFCGEEFFQHELPFDRSSMTRWRQRMGEDKLKALLQESSNSQFGICAFFRLLTHPSKAFETLPALWRGRGRFDEGDGLEKVFPRRKEQKGGHGGDGAEELAPRTVFLACQAPEFVHNLAYRVHGEGQQV